MVDEAARQELTKLAKGVMRPVLTVASRRLVQSMEHIFETEVSPLIAELERLRTFARWAVTESCFEGTGLDGAEVQEKAEDLGIIVKTKYDPAIHGPNAVDAEPGCDWYVFP